MPATAPKRAKNMKAYGRLRIRPWMLLLPAGVIVLAVHSAVLYYVVLHLSLPIAAVSGVIVLIVVKHLGLLSPLYVLFRRRGRIKDKENGNRQ
jgi:membrane protein YdbS with pleckstrin-like domain